MAEELEQERLGAPNGQPHYRMGAVARMTGLSAHTIRVWERRYGAIQPSRSPGGDRLYSEQEVARLRLLHQLKRAGHAIGTVANLPAGELERILSASRPVPPRPAESGVSLEPPSAAVRTRFLDAIARLDTHAADRIVSQLVGSLELGQLIHGFLAPVLEEIGTHWAEGRLNVAQEHAASAILRNQLSLLLRLNAGPQGGRCLIAGTPKDEWHEFGALLAALVAGSQAWHVVYLGANLPAREIAQAVRRVQAEKVLLSWVTAEAEATYTELALLRQQIDPAVEVLVGGRAAQSVTEAPKGIALVRDLRHLEQLLAPR